MGWYGPRGKRFVEAGGERFLYTNKRLRDLTGNLAFLANPITADLNEAAAKAESESDQEE